MSLRVLPIGTLPAGVHHTFNESSLADVSLAMDRMDEAAYAEFEFELSFSTAGNRVTRVNLIMWLTLDMPVWSRVDRSPQAEQDEWNRFMCALRAHEDGHIAICRREAPKTHRKLTRASAGRINSVLEEERLRIKALNDAYDHRTDHGRSQRTACGTTAIRVP
jgi:predicted secreted Zn-dependent protease